MGVPVKRALVTGHVGFLGRHFKARLEADGWYVDGCDIAATEAGSPIPRGDARDLFRQSLSPYYELVVHCAAVIGGREVIEKQPLAQAVNLELDAALFQWARTVRPGRIIYFSSSAAYPAELQQVPEFRHRLSEDDIRLDDIRSPDQLYGWAKLTGEYLASLAQREGQRVTVLRPFSGYGEDQGTDYPFAAFADRAARHEDPFIIWGDGRQVRDFIHVDDIVDGAMTLPPGTFNMGSGEPTSMRELATMFTTAAGYEPEFHLVTSAPSGVSYRVCDPARMLAHYTPKVTLAEGVRRALEVARDGIPRATR